MYILYKYFDCNQYKIVKQLLYGLDLYNNFPMCEKIGEFKCLSKLRMSINASKFIELEDARGGNGFRYAWLYDSNHILIGKAEILII